MVLAAINQNGDAFQYASEELKGDKEVVIAAANDDGYVLQSASEELKGDKEVVLAAVNQHGNALQFALLPLRNGGLQAYVEGLLDTYPVPSYVFLSTVLCGAKLFSARTLVADEEEDGEEPIARRARTKISSTCLLWKLNLGTTVTLKKKIATFAGVRCQEFCTVPWSHLTKVNRKNKWRGT